jgi:hypothetical protein
MSLVTVLRALVWRIDKRSSVSNRAECCDGILPNSRYAASSVLMESTSAIKSRICRLSFLCLLWFNIRERLEMAFLTRRETRQAALVCTDRQRHHLSVSATIRDTSPFKRHWYQPAMISAPSASIQGILSLKLSRNTLDLALTSLGALDVHPETPLLNQRLWRLDLSYFPNRHQEESADDNRQGSSSRIFRLPMC